MVSQIRMSFDVGGTFTDGVIMQGREVIAKTKSLNTEDVTTGIVKALSFLRNLFCVHRSSLNKNIKSFVGVNTAIFWKKH